MDESVENLIEEVEKRPGIYDKSLKEYSNINIKKKLWEEVYCVLIPNWNELDGENKTKAGMELQKKWNSLRNCFTRELRAQKSNQSGQGAQKRRKYIYFDKLMFLLPSVDNRDTRSNLQEEQHDSEEEMEIEEVERGLSVRRKRTHRQESFEESLLKILENKKKDPTETDEDINFSLSIVPILKSMDDCQKMEAKIQIMSLLKTIKWPSSSLNHPSSSRMQYCTGSQYLTGPSGSLYPKGPTGPQYLVGPFEVGQSHQRNEASQESDPKLHSL